MLRKARRWLKPTTTDTATPTLPPTLPTLFPIRLIPLRMVDINIDYMAGEGVQ